MHEPRGLVVLMGVALGIVTASCGCDASACGSTEIAHLTLPSTGEELSKATLTACRNEQCWTADLAELGERLTNDRFIVPSETQDPSDDVSLAVWAQLGSTDVIIDLRFHLRNAGLVQPGDVLGAVVSTAENRVIFSDTADVQTIRTSSSPCGSTECRSAEVRLASQ